MSRRSRRLDNTLLVVVGLVVVVAVYWKMLVVGVLAVVLGIAASKAMSRQPDPLTPRDARHGEITSRPQAQRAAGRRRRGRVDPVP